MKLFITCTIFLMGLLDATHWLRYNPDKASIRSATTAYPGQGRSENKCKMVMINKGHCSSSTGCSIQEVINPCAQTGEEESMPISTISILYKPVKRQNHPDESDNLNG